MKLRSVSTTCLFLPIFMLASPVQGAQPRHDDDAVLHNIGNAPTPLSSRQKVTDLMKHQELREQFRALGVSPEEIDQRIAALSDEEVRAVSLELGDLPVGGDSTVTMSVGAAIIIAILLIVFL